MLRREGTVQRPKCCSCDESENQRFGGLQKMQYESKDDVYNKTAFGTGLIQNRHSVPVLVGHDAQNWNATVRIDSYRSR